MTVYFLPKCANQAVAPNKAKPAKSWFDAPNIGQIALQVPLKASAPPNITVTIVATYLLEIAGAHPAVSSSRVYLPNLQAVSKEVSKKAETVKAPKAIPVFSATNIKTIKIKLVFILFDFLTLDSPYLYTCMSGRTKEVCPLFLDI